MALDQSALLTLLDALRSSESGDLVRQLAERLLQELIEAEATRTSAPACTSAPRRVRTSATATARRP